MTEILKMAPCEQLLSVFFFFFLLSEDDASGAGCSLDCHQTKWDSFHHCQLVSSWVCSLCGAEQVVNSSCQLLLNTESDETKSNQLNSSFAHMLDVLERQQSGDNLWVHHLVHAAYCLLCVDTVCGMRNTFTLSWLLLKLQFKLLEGVC